MPILSILVPKRSVLFVTHFFPKASLVLIQLFLFSKYLYLKENKSRILLNINCFKSFFSPQIGKNCVLYLFIYTSTFIYKNIYSSSCILHVICTQHANTVFCMPKDTYRINLLHNSFVRVPGQLFSSKDRPTIILTKTVTNQICFSECENLGKGKLFSEKKLQLPHTLFSLKNKTKKEFSIFFQTFSSVKCPPKGINEVSKQLIQEKHKTLVLNIYQKVYSRIFPFFYISHNLAASYESCGFYAVSWDDPVHNNNFQYHLNNTDKRIFMNDLSLYMFIRRHLLI